MTSDLRPDAAYVWIWRPRATEPMVAGRLARDGNRLMFNYGRSYLAREDAIPIYRPELPLAAGVIAPPAGLFMPGGIRDAAPDVWGRRAILNRRYGASQGAYDPDHLDELSYLLESGSDRTSALDFQRSATEYVPRAAPAATLAQLQNAAARIDAGLSLPPELDQALFHGTAQGDGRSQG